MMKIVSLVGARPQFIKAAPVSRALRQAGVREVLVHTGQHYDPTMSQVFFDELGIPQPDQNLGVGSSSHARQTGEMLIGIEEVLLAEKPQRVLVFGDTNTTLAGALAAAKLQLPVGHVEAGLRSFDRRMPEEMNRVLTDHLSDLLFCPSRTAVENLAAEGIRRGVYEVGDVMSDALALASDRARSCSDVLARLGLPEQGYLLVTVHRAENTDDPGRLRNILSTIEALEEPVVFPIHPRTRKALTTHGLALRSASQVRLVDPLGYLDMVRLLQSARTILTDSGGIQKEAYWLGVPCVTLREQTEWVETVEAGWNVLAGVDPARISEAVREFAPPAGRPALYGDGRAANKIAEILTEG